MITRKAYRPARTVPPGWSINNRAKLHGREVAEGDELTVRGIRGRVRFLRHVTTGAAEWVDVIAPLEGGWRSVRPERVRTVHRTRKLRRKEVAA